MKTSKQKRFAAIFAGMLCISCLTAPFSATAETADTAGENDTLAAAEELPLEGAAFLAADIDENDALDSTYIYYALLYIAQKSAGLPTSWESVVQ